jgi:hypothetical protein
MTLVDIDTFVPIDIDIHHFLLILYQMIISDKMWPNVYRDIG